MTIIQQGGGTISIKPKSGRDSERERVRPWLSRFQNNVQVLHQACGMAPISSSYEENMRKSTNFLQFSTNVPKK